MSSTPRAVRQAPLRDAPADGISRVRFTSAELLVASSWDGHVYLYDTTANALRARYAHRAAVLDVASLSAGVVVSGGIDRELRSYDWTTGTSELIGTHDGAIRCVETLSDTAVVSGGWDKKLRLWDVRAPNGCQAVHEQPDKVFAMAVSEHRGLPMIIVATAGRHVHILDPRYLDEPVQRRESQLKSQTRCIAASPNGENYAMGSVDGRVAMEYVDMSAEAQALKYAFKCHRSTGADGMDVAHPVNALAFHPVHGTFASGGCDGLVNVWDGAHKKRLCQWADYPASIASLSFTPDGRRVAIAASYTFEEGNQPASQDQIFVREVGDKEFAPKAAKGGAKASRGGAA